MNKTDTFLEYKNLVFSVAYNMLGIVADAEDMVQETYLKWMAMELEWKINASHYILILKISCPKPHKNMQRDNISMHI
jgi:hypothetical protein